DVYVSTVRCTGCDSVSHPIPSINRWATFIRRLCRLLRQRSHEDQLLYLLQDANLSALIQLYLRNPACFILDERPISVQRLQKVFPVCCGKQLRLVVIRDICHQSVPFLRQSDNSTVRELVLAHVRVIDRRVDCYCCACLTAAVVEPLSHCFVCRQLDVV